MGPQLDNRQVHDGIHIDAFTFSKKLRTYQKKKSPYPLLSPWPLSTPMHADRGDVGDCESVSQVSQFSSEEHLYTA